MSESRDDYGLLRLDEDECWDFLAKHVLGRVAVTHMEHPMVFPVNYALDGRSVVFRTAPGTKLALAGARCPAAFEVDEANETFETGVSVMVHGTIGEVNDRDERERLERLPLRHWAPGDRDHFIRIAPRWVSGRRIAAHQHDDGLSADGG
jgi:nitroimidazol reductase NimA-like FMN-containing flavoprotein (pyridoxamine 5'-phosphate oxidase superfamily)